MPVRFEDGKLRAADVVFPVHGTADGRHRIRIFIDKMITDIYVDGIDCCTRIIEPVYEKTEIFVSGEGHFQVTVYQLEAEGLFTESELYKEAFKAET